LRDEESREKDKEIWELSERGLTQQQIAAKTGLAQRTISDRLSIGKEKNLSTAKGDSLRNRKISNEQIELSRDESDPEINTHLQVTADGLNDALQREGEPVQRQLFLPGHLNKNEPDAYDHLPDDLRARLRSEEIFLEKLCEEVNRDSYQGEAALQLLSWVSSCEASLSLLRKGLKSRIENHNHKEKPFEGRSKTGSGHEGIKRGYNTEGGDTPNLSTAAQQNNTLPFLVNTV